MAMFDLRDDGGYYEPPTIDYGQGGQFGFTDPVARSPDPGAGSMDTQYNPLTGGFTGATTTNNAFTNVVKNPIASSWQDYVSQYQDANPASGGLDRLGAGLSNAGFNVTPYMYGNTPSGNELSINGQKTKLIAENGGGNPSAYTWYDGNEGSGGNAGGGGGYSGAPTPWTGGSIFDDPATAEFMRLLNARVAALNQPYTPPDLSGLTDYLKSYFQKLQGPAYTPQQMDLMQTQTLDPLSRERDAAHQRVLESAARRGLTPQSGIIQKQLSDMDNQFEQIRTQTQAGFASKAIDLDRVNAQQAASVGQLLANIEQTNFNTNENRAGQALQTAQMVPDLARQRMLDANGILSQNSVNPTQLLDLSQQSSQFDSAQTQQWMMGLAQLIPGLLGLFTGNK